MAIKAGSGGLKYAPLNRADTQARQNAAAASAGGSASASAYSANRRYAGQKVRLRYDAQQSELDRGFRAQQSAAGRENQRGMQLAGQTAAAALQEDRQKQALKVQRKQQKFQGGQTKLDQQFRADQKKLDRQNRIKQDKIQFNRGLKQDKIRFDRKTETGEKSVDDRIQYDIQTGAKTLSPDNQELYDRDLDQWIEDGVASGDLFLEGEAGRTLEKIGAGLANLKDLTPEQQKDFMRQYKAEKRRLLRTAVPNRAPTVGEQFDKNRVYLDRTGKRYPEPVEGVTTPFTVKKDGTLEPIPFSEKTGLNPPPPGGSGSDGPKGADDPWVKAGYSEEGARQWEASGFTPETAKEWITAGVTVKNAERWVNRGVFPEDAKKWQDEFDKLEVGGKSIGPDGREYQMTQSRYDWLERNKKK